MPQLIPLDMDFNVPVTVENPTGTVALAFEPVANANGLVTFSAESEQLTGALAPLLTVSLQKPSKTSRISKSRVKLVVPTGGMLAGVPTGIKDREVTIDYTIMASERSTELERWAAESLFRDIIVQGVLRDVLIKNKSFY